MGRVYVVKKMFKTRRTVDVTFQGNIVGKALILGDDVEIYIEESYQNVMYTMINGGNEPSFSLEVIPNGKIR